MKGKRHILYIGGAHCGKAYALAVAQEMLKLQGVHLVEYPKKDNESGLELTEIDLDANREAMRQNAGKMEVGTYNRDFELHEVSPLVKTNTKWYNQHLKRRKR